MYIYQKAKLIDPLNTLPINLIATYVRKLNKKIYKLLRIKSLF